MFVRNLHFTFGESSGYPIATLGDNAALLFSYGVGVHIIDWTQDDFNVFGTAHSYSVTSMSIGAPFSLDYKSGAEALLDRSKRMCFTFGIGMQPTAIFASAGTQATSINFSILPTAKIEYGIATRIATFKLRATGFLGSPQYLNVEKIQQPFQYQTFYDITVKGKSQFAIALVIMPMAGKWEDAAWFR
jgi:hypothetical protein